MKKTLALTVLALGSVLSSGAFARDFDDSYSHRDEQPASAQAERRDRGERYHPLDRRSYDLGRAHQDSYYSKGSRWDASRHDRFNGPSTTHERGR